MLRLVIKQKDYIDGLGTVQGLERNIGSAYRAALRDALPILKKSAQKVAAAEFTKRRGKLIKAIKYRITGEPSKHNVKGEVYVDLSVAPGAAALAGGTEILPHGRWLAIPGSANPDWPFINTSKRYEGAFWKTSRRGNLMLVRSTQPGDLEVLVVLVPSVRMPFTDWFNKGIELGLPDFARMLFNRFRSVANLTQYRKRK